MNVITIEETAFYTLVEQVVNQLGSKVPKVQDRWISGEEAMNMLRITSKTTLQKYRDQGKIRFSQPEKKHILYDRDSIEYFLNKNSKEIF
jgi:sucrose-6-phosphate hydrolase SacC (GH32 family)